MRPLTALLLLLLAFIFSVAAAAEPQQLQYSVVYSDQNGVTHFRNEYFPMDPGSQMAGSVPYFVSPYLDAQKLGFLRFPSDYKADWHPSPSKRFVMVLSGSVEVEVGDGARRRFPVGSVLLVTDVEGRGHLTTVIGNEAALFAWVPVP